MNLFDKLSDVSNSVTSLEDFLNDNMQLVYDFNNLNYKESLKYIDSAERYILLQNSVVEQLNFSQSYNKAFISILFDFYERFGCSAALRVVNNILMSNDINIGHRLCAANLYLFGIDSASTLISRYNAICENLQIALQFEEDNEKKIFSTFSNFYSYVLRTVPRKYVEELRNKILASIETSQYQFLKSESISKLIFFDYSSVEVAYAQIQDLIDNVLGNISRELVVPTPDTHELLIETGSQYSESLVSTSKDFQSIRKVSIIKFNDLSNQTEVYESLGRGVSILKNESQLLSYMKSFGSSHHAKLLSALGKFPFDEISGKVDIIDWGCGQGIASMVCLDFLSKKSITLDKNTLTLIEPSLISLKRAALHIRHYDSSLNIKTICKDMDSLVEADLIMKPINTKIHFFSNILDVDDFSMEKLFKLIESTQTGLNYFVCVSPYITDAKADRVGSFCRYFENNYDTFHLILEKANGGRKEDEYWNCINNYNNCMCPEHPHKCGGRNKWTRVIRLFRVRIHY